MNTKNQSNISYIFLLVLIIIIAYFNSINGGFVYDDNSQIEKNHLIQNSEHYWQALKSDVWSFKSDSKFSLSNYWRPTFVSWLIVNHTLYDLNPTYWHITNIFIHILACVLAFYYLTLWIPNKKVVFSITALYSIHPTHSESVAWISGSPDILFSLFFILSLFALHQSLNMAKNIQIRLTWMFITSLLYLLSLGAKEIGLLLLPIYFFITLWSTNQQSLFKFKLLAYKNAVIQILPYVLCIIIYLIARHQALGFFSKDYNNGIDFITLLMSIPNILFFYISHAFFPIELSINYDIRAVQNYDLYTVLIPLIVTITVATILIKMALKSRVQFIGLLFLVLPLLPALNIAAFQSEQIVHDRYLYFSILGLYMIVFPFLEIKLKFNLTLLIPLLLLGSLYMYQTAKNNIIWGSNLKIWERAVDVDSKSSFNWSQLGSHQSKNKDYKNSIESFKKSISIGEYQWAYYGLAKNYAFDNQFNKSLDSLDHIFKSDNILDLHLLYISSELAAIIYEGLKDYDKAENILKNTVHKLPLYKAALTNKLAIIYYKQNKKQQALDVLNSVKDIAKNEFLDESKQVYFRLGILYAELNQVETAISYFMQYIDNTKKSKDKTTQKYRNISKNYLNKNSH